MPYARNSELPDSVRDALPAAAQSQFRGAFNGAMDEGSSEEQAFQIAWGAVKRDWKKGPGGKWVKKMVSLALAKSADISCGSCSFYELRVCDKHNMKTHEKEVCSEFEKAFAEQTTEQTLGFEMVKAKEDEMLAFGWLYVAKMEDGRQVVDVSGDVVDVPTLEKASYEFVLKYRDAGERHQKDADKNIIPVGKLVECMVFTPEKIEALGIPDGVMKQGIWVGFKIDEPETWEKVKSGDYKMFSLGGTAIPELIGG